MYIPVGVVIVSRTSMTELPMFEISSDSPSRSFSTWKPSAKTEISNLPQRSAQRETHTHHGAVEPRDTRRGDSSGAEGINHEAIKPRDAYQTARRNALSTALAAQSVWQRRGTHHDPLPTDRRKICGGSAQRIAIL